jgi:heat shock protein HspQ
MTDKALFSIGQLIHHKRFGYRGVIVDVDPCFMLSEEWYETMTKSQPPRDQPWYHVLVHNSTQQTYVAQRNLEADDSAAPIEHPKKKKYFSGFAGGRYQSGRKVN